MLSENNTLTNVNPYMQLSATGSSFILPQSSPSPQLSATGSSAMATPSASNYGSHSANISPSPSSSCLLSPPQANNRRKYSLPLIYPNQQSPSEYLESSARELRASFQSTLLANIALSSKTKRLSQVGIAVGNHLSATIGWKMVANHSEIVRQSKCLCARYVRFKLRKCGVAHKRLNWQKLKSMCALSLDANTNQVANELKYLTLELERLYPKIYKSVLNNMSCYTFTSVANVQSTLQLLAQELFRNDITWARIAAFYALMGALAVDCAQIGRPEYVTHIIDTFTDFIDRDIAGWIAQQGGWDSLIYRFRTEDYWRKTLKYTLLSISILFWAFLAYCLT